MGLQHATLNDRRRRRCRLWLSSVRLPRIATLLFASGKERHQTLLHRYPRLSPHTQKTGASTTSTSPSPQVKLIQLHHSPLPLSRYHNISSSRFRIPRSIHPPSPSNGSLYYYHAPKSGSAPVARAMLLHPNTILNTNLSAAPFLASFRLSLSLTLLSSFILFQLVLVFTVTTVSLISPLSTPRLAASSHASERGGSCMQSCSLSQHQHLHKH